MKTRRSILNDRVGISFQFYCLDIKSVTDTRRVIEKAAERTGKTIGQCLNEDVRCLAQGPLTQTQLPAAPVDIQNQIDHLTKTIEGIADRIPEKGKQSFRSRFSK